MRSVERVSKPFYLGSIIGGLLTGLALLVIFYVPLYSGFTDLRFSDPLTLVSKARWEVFVLGLILLLYAVVILWMLLYKAWEAIQPGHPRTTPGKAIGYMFIPFYNYYWVFQAWWGFARDYNSYVRQNGVTHFRLSEGLFLAPPILTVVGAVPVVGYFTWIGSLVVLFIVANSLCDAINHLSRTELVYQPAWAETQPFSAPSASTEPATVSSYSYPSRTELPQEPALVISRPLSAPSMQAKLVVMQKGEEGREFTITGEEAAIGRWDSDAGAFPDIDLSEDDPNFYISRHHARIFVKGGRYFIEDLGSTNKTVINKINKLNPHSPVELKNGDEVIVGKTFLKFVIEY